MNNFKYESGEKVEAGDTILFHGEPGTVLFVVIQKTGDAALDWYLEQWPSGGFMIETEGCGRVFRTESPDEDFVLVSKRHAG